jgi:hypothetical protein
MGYVRLCLKEREEIYRLLREEVPKHGIAKALGRSDRTILDEIKRGAGDALGYLPDRAQAHADAQASKRRESPNSLRAAQLTHLHAQLQLDYSCEQIAGRLKQQNSPLVCCHETLYKMAYSEGGRALGLPALMPRSHKKRMPRRAHKPKVGGIVGAVSIHERPAHSNDRSTFGHPPSLFELRRDRLGGRRREFPMHASPECDHARRAPEPLCLPALQPRPHHGGGDARHHQGFGRIAGNCAAFHHVRSWHRKRQPPRTHRVSFHASLLL